MSERYACPGCGRILKWVPPSKWLNCEQWDASKAGDLFCDACPETTGTAGTADTGFAYFNVEHLDALRVPNRPTASFGGQTHEGE